MNARPPILRAKSYGSPSVFKPENLLREASRQMGVGSRPVPKIVLLDPDGDILKWLKEQAQAELSLGWALLPHRTISIYSGWSDDRNYCPSCWCIICCIVGRTTLCFGLQTALEHHLIR
jgi:hypothetical protein